MYILQSNVEQVSSILLQLGLLTYYFERVNACSFALQTSNEPLSLLGTWLLLKYNSCWDSIRIMQGAICLLDAELVCVHGGFKSREAAVTLETRACQLRTVLSIIWWHMLSSSHQSYTMLLCWSKRKR